MKNPYDLKDFDRAFDPMFTDEIVVETSKGSQTLKCVVFTDNTSDVLTNDMIDSDIEEISINIRKEDWWVMDEIEVGDSISRNNQQYKVTNVVDDFALGKVIKVRSVQDD